MALGAIARTTGTGPAAAGGAAATGGAGEVVREFLSLTVLFDHDVVDGVPVARFLRRLTESMEDARGL